MATHTTFQEQNDTARSLNGDIYPVWIEPTTLAGQKTISVISAWQLSNEELAAVIASEGFVFLRFAGGQPPCAIYWANAVDFEGQNAVYGAPGCFPLAVHRADALIGGKPTFTVTSAWQLDEVGMKQLRENGGVVFLRVIGGQPEYVEVFGINPIQV